MSLIKHAIDAPFTDPWITRVGKLIINFGALEFETYLWLVQLTEAPEKIFEFSKMRFAQRIEMLTELVKQRGFSEDWKLESEKLWNEALILAQFRNRIAHNPLGFGWNKEANKGEPDFIGIVDVRPRNDRQGALATKSEMDNFINCITSLAMRLAVLRSDWCSIRDLGAKSVNNSTK